MNILPKINNLYYFKNQKNARQSKTHLFTNTFTTQDEPDVNREDQTYINEFSRLYSKNKTLDAELKKINEILESLKDADAAIEESFGSNLKLTIGECFVITDEDQAKEYVEKMRKKYTDNKAVVTSKYDTNKKRLDEIKVILYAKF